MSLIEIDENALFEEDLSETIFENIKDLDVMSYINERIRGKSTNCCNNSLKIEKLMNVSKINKASSYKEYFQFIEKRLKEMIAIRPGADPHLLFRIALMEWNHKCVLENLKRSHVTTHCEEAKL